MPDGTTADLGSCIYSPTGDEADECGAPATTRIDHPLYDGEVAVTCDEHEPRRHEGGHGCGGHIIKGECYCS